MKVSLCCVGLVASALAFSLTPGTARASASPQAIAVLAQEERRLAAVAAGNANALRDMLDENYTHITYRGALVYRHDELVGLARRQPVAKAAEQTVDFIGSAALVQGVLTMVRPGGRALRLRYTNVYRQIDGRWILKTAQETAIAAF